MLKWLSIALLLLLAMLQYQLWAGEGGLSEYNRVKARADELQESNALLSDRNDRLAAEVVDLKNGLDAIEERARNDLGMVRSDEQFFWVPSERASRRPPEVAPPGADQGADDGVVEAAGEMVEASGDTAVDSASGGVF